jgi:RecA/RadA recombinase
LYYTLANNQRLGGESVLFESEGAFNPDFFRNMGGDPSKLTLIPADKVEDVFDGIIMICKEQEKQIAESKKTKGAVAMPRMTVIGWDSIAATGTKHLFDTGMDKRDMSKSGAMSQGTQLITTAAKSCNVCIIGVNQTREAIGSKDSATHTPGGNAWPFHSSQRLELMYDGGSRTSLIFDRPLPGQKPEDTRGREEIGRQIKGYVVKNKCASPFSRFTLPIYTLPGRPHPLYDRDTKLGIDFEQHLFDFYLTGRFFLPDGQRVLHIPTPGYYSLHQMLDPEQRKFREKAWLEILEMLPALRTLPYDLKPQAPTATGTVSGAEPEVTV